MFNTRIYRAAFLPAVIAVVVLMFSLEPAPEPLEGPVSTPAFEGSDAARPARAIAALAPERQPGSAGDRAVADLVRERFARSRAARSPIQDFEIELRGRGRDDRRTSS